MEEQNNKLYIFSADQAEALASAILANQDAVDREEQFYRIVDALIPSDQSASPVGTANAFHNLTVSAIKIANDYLTALEIAMAGLKLHGRNTDLLADAIRYGANCGQIDTCERYTSQLLAIDKKEWTWRAFSFLIDYRSANMCPEADILSLIKDYQRAYPDKEDSWFCEYEYYKDDNTKKAYAEAALEKAEGNVTVCPKTWLQRADRLADDGKYTEAFQYTSKIRSHPQSSESVNMGYVYFLRGICQLSVVMNDSDDGMFAEHEYKENEVMAVYDSFRIALTQSDLRDNTRKQILEKLGAIRSLTGFEFPDRLCAVIG